MTVSDLPVAEALPRLLAALADTGVAVLAAPPGAGKTTAVPLALAGAPWASGRILMLEPRRLAARAAAERMAETLGEPVGRSVGYRIRGEARTGDATRIEVVTEGILTRMLQGDPELSGISAVIFDEVHERSIHTDLGLALALEVRAALRPELRLLAMSATLDTGRMAAVMGGAPVIESGSRAYPVETRHLARPWAAGGDTGPRAYARAVAELTLAALAEDPGDALVFLPGAGEIRRVGALLEGATDAAIRPLYGALPFAAQRAALAPDPDGRRRVVLATSIAETSLTVAGVRIVVDGGRARRARVNRATGMAALVTVPVSRAEADQRRGRAGRTAPGVCHRLWTRAEEGALPAFAPPEIAEADLAPLALELAVWGVEDPAELAFPDPPPAPALTEARALLSALGALDARGRVTPHGRRMAARPLHPRLAHMMQAAEAEGLEAEGALIAALLSDRDPWAGGQRAADLTLRLTALAGGDGPLDPGAAGRIRAEAARLAPGRKPRRDRLRDRAGALLALAYPDRVGLRRPGEAPRYLLSNGRGAALAAEDALAGARLIVAADVEDRGREATIRLAAPLTEADLRAAFPERIAWHEEVAWSRRSGAVEARRRERFGALVLDERRWDDAPPDRLADALIEGIRERGIDALPWSAGAARLRARVAWLRSRGGPLADRLPDWSDAALAEGLETWLAPWLTGQTRIEALAELDLGAVLASRLDRETSAALDRAAPAHVETPLGRRLAIDYSAEVPMLSVRVQELFGLDTHPTAGEPPVALVLELLSPAGRPVQRTRDLPGFWASSYRDVAKDMRARYPRHPWPEDPAAADPTLRAKRRRR